MAHELPSAPRLPTLPRRLLNWVRSKIPQRPLERFVYLSVAGMIVLFALFAITIVIASRADHRATDADQKANAYGQALRSANNKLTSAGVAPVPTPTIAEGITGPPGPSGPPGPGPTEDQIQQAVNSYCLTFTCAQGPTAAQVAQAVASFCNSQGECRGPTGVSGVPGPSGAVGQPGADATAQQVADAVATYCAANNGCTGPQGPSGASGQPGANGASGAPGGNGQPPFSWTYTSALGVMHTCSRTANFDPSAPTYTCT